MSVRNASYISVKHQLSVQNTSYHISAKHQLSVWMQNTSYHIYVKQQLLHQCETPVIISVWNTSYHISAKHQLSVRNTSYHISTKYKLSWHRWESDSQYLRHDTASLWYTRHLAFRRQSAMFYPSLQPVPLGASLWYTTLVPVYGILDTQRFSDHRTPPDEVCGVFLFQGGIEHSTLRAT